MSDLRSIEAHANDSLLLETTSKGSVTNYFAVLKRFDPSGGGVSDQTWNRSTLEGPGGSATLANASGYNVIVFPNLGADGSIDVKLTIAGMSDKMTISKNESGGWRIFIF